jgi:hypothetical protein
MNSEAVIESFKPKMSRLVRNRMNLSQVTARTYLIRATVSFKKSDSNGSTMSHSIIPRPELKPRLRPKLRTWVKPSMKVVDKNR